ncbi:monocarboxylate transporter 12-like [Mizuhopecten yessoensis]|uniref:monocarboxylate transporter 12-like n=1 Tax=Mizuhopecten yessoensis TaxID=6573 RepID=UPI000B45F17D|nr:monocarboxylate transporter 12-like [Mizuhopecten yessoensis]
MAEANKSSKGNNSKSEIEETKRNIHEPIAPDGGWGWVVLISSFVHSGIVDGICLTFGVFMPDFLAYFGGSNAKTQLLSSIINGTYLSLGLVSGALMDRLGCRRVVIVGGIVSSIGLFLSTFSPSLDVMILLYGVGTGVGFGLLYTPSVVVVGHYFIKRRALATGIAVCGSGVGGFVFAPLSVFLIDRYGWKGALWILSAISLNSVIFGAFYRPLLPSKVTPISSQIKPETTETDSNSNTREVDKNSIWKTFCIFFRTTINLSLLTSPTFVLYGCSGFLLAIGFYIPFNFLPVFATDIHLSADEGAILLSVIGIFNTLSRVLVGLVSDQPWADCVLINSTALLVGGLATCFLPLYNTYSALLSYSAVFGTAVGSFVALKSIILVELKGVDWLSKSLGLLNVVISIPVFIGSPIAGALSDLTENYNSAFYFAGGTIGLAGLLCFPLRRIARWERNRNTDSNDSKAADVTVTMTTGRVVEHCSSNTLCSNHMEAEKHINHAYNEA